MRLFCQTGKIFETSSALEGLRDGHCYWWPVEL